MTSSAAAAEGEQHDGQKGERDDRRNDALLQHSDRLHPSPVCPYRRCLLAKYASASSKLFLAEIGPERVRKP